MKNLLSVLLFATILIVVTSFKLHPADHAIPCNDQQRIEVVFNRHLEFNDLVKIKLDMSQHGIVLNYTKLEFDEDGKLIIILFQVDCKEDFQGQPEV